MKPLRGYEIWCKTLRPCANMHERRGYLMALRLENLITKEEFLAEYKKTAKEKLNEHRQSEGN